MSRAHKGAPKTAGVTRLYQALREAGKSPAWLAAALRVPEEMVANWTWGLDLPPEEIRRRVEVVLAESGVDWTSCWAPLSAASLRPVRLRLVENEPETQEEPDMEITSREYLTQAELERFGVPLDPSTGERPDPFDGPEDPTNIFRSPALQACEAVLWEAVKKRQILVFVGEPGAGKSTLLRRAYGLASRQRQMKFITCSRLDRRKMSHDTLAVAILRDLTGRDTSGLGAEQRDELLRSTLAEQRGVFPVVFIDEAHHLSNQALLALKHVWDSHTLFRQLAVVLVGHPPLAHRLAQDAALREFTIRARIVEMPAFDAAATGAYLDWRWGKVGAGKATDVFSAAALEILARRGRSPQMINNLAVRALRAAAPTGRRVEAEHVGRV